VLELLPPEPPPFMDEHPTSAPASPIAAITTSADTSRLAPLRLKMFVALMGHSPAG
jgi:hypothetical protein